jgi:predicted component of type VI protein secretion system
MALQSFQLVMQKGPTPGKVYELTLDDLTIGRDISNRIVINDAEVSRKHTRLTLQGGTYVVEDLGSTNGTFVNGQRLSGPAILRPGDLVMLGEKISLTFEAPGYDPNATMVATSGPAAPRETVRVPMQNDYGYAPPGQPAPQPPSPYQQPGYPQPAQPAYQQPPPPPYQPPVQPQYQQAPAPMYAEPPVDQYMPADSYGAPLEEPPRKNNTTRNAVLAGCGCLVVILCCLVVTAVAFDTMNLYCQAPFNALGGILWACP